MILYQARCPKGITSPAVNYRTAARMIVDQNSRGGSSDHQGCDRGGAWCKRRSRKTCGYLSPGPSNGSVCANRSRCHLDYARAPARDQSGGKWKSEIGHVIFTCAASRAADLTQTRGDGTIITHRRVTAAIAEVSPTSAPPPRTGRTAGRPRTGTAPTPAPPGRQERRPSPVPLPRTATAEIRRQQVMISQRTYYQIIALTWIIA
jgi:hypothetical protein